MDCVIGTGFFELKFEIESYDPAVSRSIFDKRDDQNKDDQNRDSEDQSEDSNKNLKANEQTTVSKTMGAGTSRCD